MKAFSVRQPFAGWIASGKKRLELRTWRAPLGDLLVCAGKNGKETEEVETQIFGQAIAIVTVVGYVLPDVEHSTEEMVAYNIDGAKELSEEDLQDLLEEEWDGVSIGWILFNPRPIKPFPVIGKLGIFEVEIQEN